MWWDLGLKSAFVGIEGATLRYPAQLLVEPKNVSQRGQRAPELCRHQRGRQFLGHRMRPGTGCPLPSHLRLQARQSARPAVPEFCEPVRRHRRGPVPAIRRAPDPARRGSGRHASGARRFRLGQASPQPNAGPRPGPPRCGNKFTLLIVQLTMSTADCQSPTERPPSDRHRHPRDAAASLRRGAGPAVPRGRDREQLRGRPRLRRPDARGVRSGQVGPDGHEQPAVAGGPGPDPGGPSRPPGDDGRGQPRQDRGRPAGRHPGGRSSTSTTNCRASSRSFRGAREAFGDDDQRAHVRRLQRRAPGRLLPGRGPGGGTGRRPDGRASTPTRSAAGSSRTDGTRPCSWSTSGDRPTLPTARGSRGWTTTRSSPPPERDVKAPYSRTVPDGTVLGPPSSLSTAEPRTTTPGSKVQSPLTVRLRACFSDGASVGDALLEGGDRLVVLRIQIDQRRRIGDPGQPTVGADLVDVGRSSSRSLVVLTGRKRSRPTPMAVAPSNTSIAAPIADSIWITSGEDGVGRVDRLLVLDQRQSEHGVALLQSRATAPPGRTTGCWCGSTGAGTRR